MTGQTKFLIALGLLVVLGYYSVASEEVRQETITNTTSVKE
tara:strand:+ start:572 stop:694 length:123 start_codon:yes stop_codon:yes gene_type:complete